MARLHAREVCQQQHPQQALAHFDEAITQARKVNNPYLEGAAIVSCCSLHARVGDPGEALRAFADAVRLWNRVVNTPGRLTSAAWAAERGQAAVGAQFVRLLRRDDGVRLG